MSALGQGLNNIDWAGTNLTKFEKNFYIEDPRVSKRSEKEIADFRALKQMTVSVRSRIPNTNTFFICFVPGFRTIRSFFF